MPPFLPLLAKLAPSIIGGISSIFQNKKSRKFSRETEDRQYRRNLTDWERQNRYNDPGAQMQRLQDAGLNPAMMYGGSSGASASGQSSSQVKSPETPRPEFNRIDTSQVMPNILSVYDIAIKKGQKGLLDQQIIKEALENQGDFEDYTTRRRLVDISADAALTNISATQQNIAASKQGVLKSQQDILSSQQGIKASEHGLDMAGQKNKREIIAQEMDKATHKVRKSLLELELDIRENKGNPNDPAWQKLILEILNSPDKLDKVIKTIKKYWFSKDGNKKPIITQPIFMDILDWFKRK